MLIVAKLILVRESQKGRKAYIDDDGNLYLDCSKCGEVLIEDEFIKLKHGFLGKHTQCKSCDKKYREANKERIAERKREYYENNREKVLEYRRNYAKNNPEKARINKQRRRARKRALPDTLTLEQMNQLGTTCVLTGQENVHLDHIIPISIGHGGTTYENMIPLSAELNLSKHDSNIFEWAEQNHKRLGFSMNLFYKVMTDVADRNGMTLEEYRDYVYWCFDNPADTISLLVATS